MADVGTAIYLWREFYNISQSQLAKKAGVPRPNLSAIESGKIEPSIGTLRRLAYALNTTAGVIINGSPPLDFKKTPLSRESQENIVRFALGQARTGLSGQQKAIARLLSQAITNKRNARQQIYKDTFKRSRQRNAANWLMLKAGLADDMLKNLLSRLDKHMALQNCPDG